MTATDETLPPTDETPLISESVDDVVTLTLNRPRTKNALSRDLVLDLGDALAHFSAEPTTRAIVLTGADGAFCSGADLTTVRRARREEVPGRIEEFHRLVRHIVSADQPVIAAMDGPAVGFGVDLALACDVRIMTHRAFLEPSFARVGLMPDGGGTHWMPAYLGARAFEVLALSERLPAADCHDLGIATHLTESAKLAETARNLARRFATAAPLAVAAIKRSLREHHHDALEAALAREKAGQTRLLATADFDEGVASFLTKRAPRFIGK